MQQFNNLYGFIEFAKANRKYPESTANNLKSAVKIFEKVLTEEEHASLSLVEARIEEIFTNVISSNRNKNAASLNTYKTRLLRVIGDFKKYNDPKKMQNWTPRPRQVFGGQKNPTPLLNKKDKQDKDLSKLSYTTHTPVEITITLRILPPGSRG